MRSLFLVAHLALLAVPVANANHVDIQVDDEFKDSFEDTEAVHVDSPTDLEFTPDGKFLFVTEKEGNLWVVDVEDMDNGGGEPKLSLALSNRHPMCFNGARGLLSVGVHPDYPVNRWIYMFYNYDKYGDCASYDKLGEGPVNRLSRFVLNEDHTVDPDSEVVFFTTPRLPSQSHNSGDIAFGKDGYLYITVGDAGTRSKENDDGVKFPQALDRLMGKIVRLTDTGEIPQDNPYTPAMGEPNSERCNKEGTSSKASIKCQEIYATGLRNPYRFAMDPNADGTRFFINDVGRQTWERILEGGDNYVGANYGYPFRQGPCAAANVKDGHTDCGPSEFVDPVHYYLHDEEDGGAVTGAAFVPNNIGWPESFRNAYLYADYAFGGIYRITPGGKGCPYPQCTPPISDFATTKKTFSGTKKVVAMQFGPHKGSTSLYYITRGDTGMKGETGIFRISFTGSTNRGPKPKIVAEPTVGFAPLAVNFDATQSVDPDGDALSYEWDFDGDGIIDSTKAKPSFVYTESGTYAATLTVKDGKGGSSTTKLRIDADNTPPIPKIISPKEGTTFAVGDVLKLVGSATDGEDGKLSDMQLTWEVRQHHNNHYHPFLDPTEGNKFDLWPAPPPEDFDASTTSYLAILLTATDSNGLSATTSRIVMPKVVDVVFDTNPSGLDIIANGDKFATPATITTWENHAFMIEAPTQTMDGAAYGLTSWSDGGTERRHEIVVSAKNLKPYVADMKGLSPLPQIVSPVAGTTFAVDDKLKLVGSATDGAGNELPDSSLTWEIHYRSSNHKDHHPFLVPTNGNNIEINGKLEPFDLKSAEKGYLEVVLTATDAAGLDRKTSIVLEPKKVEVEFDTNPSGLDLVLDGETYTTPVTITTWENHKFNIRSTSQDFDSINYKFGKWSDGGKRSHRYKASSSGEKLVADFHLALPRPEILSIQKGSTFTVGEKIKLFGAATDNRGDYLPDEALTWEVLVYNEEEDKYRTILGLTQGNDIDVETPQPRDFKEAETSYIEILLTAQDSTGLSSTHSFILEPNKVDLVFDTEPSGFFVIADGQQLRTPAAVTSWEGHKFIIEAPTQKKRHTTYGWHSWSDGGAASHEFVVPAQRHRPHKIVAVYGEPRPNQESVLAAGSLLFYIVVVGAAVAAILLMMIGFLFCWNKRSSKQAPVVDITDMNIHDDELKNIDLVDPREADNSTLRENDSQDDIMSDHSGIAPSAIESSNSSIGAASSIAASSLLFSSPFKRYLLSSSGSIKDAESEQEEPFSTPSFPLTVDAGDDAVSISTDEGLLSGDSCRESDGDSSFQYEI